MVCNGRHIHYKVCARNTSWLVMGDSAVVTSTRTAWLGGRERGREGEREREGGTEGVREEGMNVEYEIVIPAPPNLQVVFWNGDRSTERGL